MEPRASMPWRVLESPPLDGEDDSSEIERPAKTPVRSAGASAAPRVVAVGAVAVVCAVVAFVLATSGGAGSVQVDGASGLVVPPGSSRPSDVATGGGSELVVEIVGAVRQPGVYRLPAGSRVGDLLTAAGGYSPRVDTARSEQELNLASALTDGAQVRVPSRDEPPAVGGAGSATSTQPSGVAKVDLNHATQAELEALPGIGPSTAQKILAARDEAPFASVDELRSRGILGEKTFDKLKDLVSVG
jgi:competence protein ComEA